MKRETRVLEQISGMADLVMAGEDAQDVINGTVDEIREGYGSGPYPLGSKVKVNSPWSGEGIDGGSVSLSKGDVVSIAQTGLGEQGQDRMILLSDGSTRAVVPFKILGESIVHEGEVGPDGHKVTSAKGSAFSKSGKVVGQPKPTSPKEIKGSRKPTSLVPSTVVGQAKPRDGGQAKGSQVPLTISGKRVEDVKHDVLIGLEGMLDEGNDDGKSTVVNLQRLLVTEKSDDMFTLVHEMMFEDGLNFTITDMGNLLELDTDALKTQLAEAKKKGKFPFNKKKDDDEDEDEEEGDDNVKDEDIAEIFGVMKKVKKDKKKK